MAELKLSWRQALETAVNRLSDDPEQQRLLQVFVDHWGLESYIPPPDIEETVRNAIAGLLACSRSLLEEKANA